MLVHVFTRFIALLLLTGAFVACTSETPATPAPCQEELSTLLTEQGHVSAPANPLMPGPLVYDDKTVPLAEGKVIDSRPLSRGDHPVERYWRHPQSCEISGGSYPWAPATSSGPAAHTKKIGIDGFGTWRVRALLVTGENSGADDDTTAWNAAFTALGVRATHQHRPSVADIETKLRDELCQGVNELESVVLVTAGRASPVSGGSLILGDEAVSYATLGDWLREGCAKAASLLWVIDASYAGEFAEAYDPGIPTRLWSASSPSHPFAPRLAPLGGGLLSQAMSKQLISRASERCLGAFPSVSNPGSLKAIHPSTTILWSVFDLDNLRDTMRTMRWEAVGRPAVNASELVVETSVYEAFQKALFNDIPHTLRRDIGEISEPPQCGNDETCELIHEGCATGPCRAWTCTGGQCELRETLGEPCDDGNDCTLEDVCRSGAICQGDVDDCSDGEPCTRDTCIFDEGCVHVPISPGEACDDGNPCTDGDVCDANETCAGEPAACDDGDPCTGTECDAIDGCTFEHVSGPCDDGLACTHQDYCKDGDCFGIAIPCDDANPCTVDSCDETEGTCLNAPTANGAPCSDGDLCTTSDGCVDGVCKGLPKPCDDGIPCSVDSCDGGECIALPPPSTCLDDQGCVQVGESSVSNPCLVCEATNVWTALNGNPCPDDGIECTLDLCEGGECVHSSSPGTCVDGQGNCVEVGQSLGGCLNCVDTGVAAVAGIGTPCNDGNPCTMEDMCAMDGLCSGIKMACCPVASVLSCGETVLGDTEFTENLQQDWSCMDGFNFKGNEGVHTFTAECDGPVSINLEAKPGVGVLLVEGASDVCAQGECSTFSQKAATLYLDAGQEIMAIVDSFGANGIYNLTVQCDCGD